MLPLIILLIFLLTFTLTSAIMLILFCKKKPIEKLKYYDDDYAIKEKIEEDKKSKVSIAKTLGALIPKVKFMEKSRKKLELELLKADMPITAEELEVVKILSSLALAFLTYAISKDIVILLVTLVIIWNIPRIFISSKKKKRIKQFNDQLNEGIMIVSNSLKAGYSFLQAIAVVVEEMKDPFSKEFRKLLKEISLGISEETALKNVNTRMESDDLRLITNAILIQKDIGGNLSEILDNISDTIRERQKIQSELKTLTAQGRLSGIIVMLIPFGLGSAIYLFDKEYIMLLFTTHIGLGLTITAFASQMLGLFMIKKIIKIDM